MDRESYDDEPIYYCKRCLSINIHQMPMVENQCYCADCGTVEVVEATFDEWDELYVEKYGHHYLELENNNEEKEKAYCY